MMATDPQKLGVMIQEFVAETRKTYPALSLSQIMDIFPWNRAPQLDPQETLGALQVREYQAELKARQAGGDRFASIVLETGKGFHEPHDETNGFKL